MKKLFIIALFLSSIISLPTLLSQESISIDGRIGIGFHLSELGFTDALNLQLAPTIETFGIGVTLQFDEVFSFAPFFDFAVVEKNYFTQGSYAIPHVFFSVTDDTFSNVFMLMFGFPFVLDFAITQQLKVGVGVSPTVIFHIPVSGDERIAIGEHYISEGRFLYPEIQLRFGYSFQDVELNVLGRSLFPIYNLWDSDSSSALHDIIFFVTFQLRFTLPDSASINPNLSAIR